MHLCSLHKQTQKMGPPAEGSEKGNQKPSAQVLQESAGLSNNYHLPPAIKWIQMMENEVLGNETVM